MTWARSALRAFFHLLDDRRGRKDDRTGQTFANGQIDVYGYDSRNRMASLTHETSSLATISAETYTWDYAGNLTAKSVDTNSWSYTYDTDDQLTEEAAPSFTAAYTYDANGNRASYTIGGVTQTYNVDNGDKLTSITSGGSTIKSYTYDTAGRTTGVTTSAGTTTLSYDYEDRVTGITYPSSATNSFSYNGLDTRVGKTDSAGTFSYVRDGADVTDPVLGDGAANYTPGVSQHRSSATTFENGDYLGTSTRQTNSSQTTTATRSYDAFGNLVSTTGTPIGPFGFVGDRGYQEDPDSGLKLLGHRYYDPSTGRFLTRDHAKDGRNWYVYCDSNATGEVDPAGLWRPIWKTFARLAFVVVDGITKIFGGHSGVNPIAPPAGSRNPPVSGKPVPPDPPPQRPRPPAGGAGSQPPGPPDSSGTVNVPLELWERVKVIFSLGSELGQYFPPIPNPKYIGTGGVPTLS